jgi:3-oxoacyl-[acyl-carrier protein] reductase
MGLATAAALSDAGAKVIMLCRNEERGKEALARLKEKEERQLELILCDLGDYDSIRAFARTVKAKHKKIDILVNNAGITKDGLMLRMTEQQWDAVIAVNLKSAFNFIHACVPIMMRQRGGSIINMASVVGVHGNAGQANYAASKAGLIALAKSIGQEMGPKGIRANAIAPGFIDTAMTQALPDEVRKEWINKIPLRRGGQVEDIANVATFLASDLSSYVSGQVIQVDGGMNM